MASTVEVRGLREIGMKLQALQNNVANKIVRDAMKVSVTPIEELARSLAPEDPSGTAKERSKYPLKKGDGTKHPKPGTLKKSIKAYRSNKSSRFNKEVWRLSARRGKSAPKSANAFYAPMAENDWGSPRTKGYQFMHLAFRRSIESFLERLRAELGKGIEANW